MEGTTFKLLGMAICAVMLIILLKQIKSELTLLITVSACVIILGAAVVNLRPNGFITSILGATSYGTYLVVLLKTLGIGITAQTVADICRDSGESAIASKVELLAKTEIMLLSLPLLEEIVKLSGEILKI